MNWLSRLLGFKDVDATQDISKLLEDSRKESAKLFSGMKNTKGKNISEPVFAMLSAWEDNPKRFKISNSINQEDFHSSRFYKSPSAKLTVSDLFSKEEFTFGLWLESDSWQDIGLMYHVVPWFGEHKLYPVLGCKVNYKPSWMTQDELDFIIETVKPFYLNRVNRYRDIVESRIDRTRKASELKSEIAKHKERDRLTGVYK